jgi:hypothetical protein
MVRCPPHSGEHETVTDVGAAGAVRLADLTGAAGFDDSAGALTNLTGTEGKASSGAAGPSAAGDASSAVDAALARQMPGSMPFNAFSVDAAPADGAAVPPMFNAFAAASTRAAWPPPLPSQHANPFAAFAAAPQHTPAPMQPQQESRWGVNCLPLRHSG